MGNRLGTALVADDLIRRGLVLIEALMSDLFRSLSAFATRVSRLACWLKFKQRSRNAEVIIHDPAADRPHDMDDPYFDTEVQRRIAGVIARSAGGSSIDRN
jgi:hypothetical protein